MKSREVLLPVNEPNKSIKAASGMATLTTWVIPKMQSRLSRIVNLKMNKLRLLHLKDWKSLEKGGTDHELKLPPRL